VNEEALAQDGAVAPNEKNITKNSNNNFKMFQN
jgi:hypothetical protein